MGITIRMGIANSCCGNSGGRAMTHEAILKMQGAYRSYRARIDKNKTVRGLLSQIGDIESPRNPGQKMIDDD